MNNASSVSIDSLDNNDNNNNNNNTNDTNVTNVTGANTNTNTDTDTDTDTKTHANSVVGLDSNDDDKMITLVSQENDKIEINIKTAKMSVLLKTMIENDKDETEYPLPNVTTEILKRVVVYMNHHVINPSKEIEKPLKSANMAEVVSQWDADFVDVTQEDLFNFILCANYMDIKSLLDLTCAKVASMIKGKTVEDIRTNT